MARDDEDLPEHQGGAVRVVERRCLVCEWAGEVTDRGDADAPPTCPWCHAPTEVVRVLTVEAEANDSGPDAKNMHAAALGRLGGLKGGRARAEALSATRRREIARKAARARWKKKP
jgi:hypothetical protein